MPKQNSLRSLKRKVGGCEDTIHNQVSLYLHVYLFVQNSRQKSVRSIEMVRIWENIIWGLLLRVIGRPWAVATMRTALPAAGHARDTVTP